MFLADTNGCVVCEGPKLRIQFNSHDNFGKIQDGFCNVYYIIIFGINDFFQRNDLFNFSFREIEWKFGTHNFLLESVKHTGSQ